MAVCIFIVLYGKVHENLKYVKMTLFCINSIEKKPNLKINLIRLVYVNMVYILW